MRMVPRPIPKTSVPVKARVPKPKELTADDPLSASTRARIDILNGSKGFITPRRSYLSVEYGPPNVFCVRTPPLIENMDASGTPSLTYVQPCALGNEVKSKIMLP